MLSKERLGERIRAQRLARGLTLKEFGRAAGLSAPHLCEIEQGKTSPTFGALAKIAMALDRPVAYLLEEETRPDVSIVRCDERVAPGDPEAPNLRLSSLLSECGAPLTHGIPSGRLAVYRVVLAAEERAGTASGGAADAAGAAGAVTVGAVDDGGGDGAGRRVPGSHGILRQPARLLTELVHGARPVALGTMPGPAAPSPRRGGCPAGQEGGVLLAGRLEARVDGEVRTLERGDVALFDAAHPHELFNPGPEPAELLWFRLDGTDD